MYRYIICERTKIIGEKAMTSVNSINVNTQGVGGNFGLNAKAKPEEKEKGKAQEEVVAGEQKPQVAAGDVLSFMAQGAVSVAPASAKTIDPAKYVDNESAARIAGFMSQFEDIVAANLTEISKEFPNMSDGAKQALALAQFEE